MERFAKIVNSLTIFTKLSILDVRHFSEYVCESYTEQTQLTFTCSKSTIEIPEKGEKYVQS